MLRQRPFSSSMDARKTAVSPRYFSLFRPPTNGTYVGACTRRHLGPIFRGRRAAWDAARRRRPGRVRTRKKRLDNGPRLNPPSVGQRPGRVHLAGLGMDEARPGRPPHVPRPGNAPVPLVHPSAPGRSGYPAGARLAGSAIERRLVWAMPRPGNAPAPLLHPAFRTGSSETITVSALGNDGLSSSVTRKFCAIRAKSAQKCEK